MPPLIKYGVFWGVTDGVVVGAVEVVYVVVVGGVVVVVVYIHVVFENSCRNS